ncbi:hypothetical protein TREES_T100006604 [Tupaia chinensis]|uniref:Uncharacterized protein n=1 Tax=Tupaia chinensis TaxID=246437 RepID=L9KPL6_TUPCH|nr:hypothetical protein TREES_T100006604 [Tupaia chinensis]
MKATLGPLDTFAQDRTSANSACFFMGNDIRQQGLDLLSVDPKSYLYFIPEILDQKMLDTTREFYFVLIEPKKKANYYENHFRLTGYKTFGSHCTISSYVSLMLWNSDVVVKNVCASSLTRSSNEGKGPLPPLIHKEHISSILTRSSGLTLMGLTNNLTEHQAGK